MTASPAASTATAATSAPTSAGGPLAHFGLSVEVQRDLFDLAMEGSIFDVKMHYSILKWQSATTSSRTWENVAFPPNPRSAIPKAPGVYAFVVMPDLFDLPQISGLLYVGKATSLYERVGSYVYEIDKRFSASSRPHIWRMVNAWNGYLRYFFTTTVTVDEAEQLEDQMIAALVPHFNKEVKADVGLRRRAFP